MIKALCLIAALCCMANIPAAAQNSGRFSFQPVEGGVMRLDTETGQVSHCLKAGESFTCRSVADDRAALADEIDRLKRENDLLRQNGAKPNAQGRLQLPSEEDIDKAMGLFEKMMRRMMRSFREDGAPTDKL
jgi:hypothetical protein